MNSRRRVHAPGRDPPQHSHAQRDEPRRREHEPVRNRLQHSRAQCDEPLRRNRLQHSHAQLDEPLRRTRVQHRDPSQYSHAQLDSLQCSRSPPREALQRSRPQYDELRRSRPLQRDALQQSRPQHDALRRSHPSRQPPVSYGVFDFAPKYDGRFEHQEAKSTRTAEKLAVITEKRRSGESMPSRENFMSEFRVTFTKLLGHAAISAAKRGYQSIRIGCLVCAFQDVQFTHHDQRCITNWLEDAGFHTTDTKCGNSEFHAGCEASWESRMYEQIFLSFDCDEAPEENNPADLASRCAKLTRTTPYKLESDLTEGDMKATDVRVSVALEDVVTSVARCAAARGMSAIALTCFECMFFGRVREKHTEPVGMCMSQRHGFGVCYGVCRRGHTFLEFVEWVQ